MKTLGASAVGLCLLFAYGCQVDQSLGELGNDAGPGGDDSGGATNGGSNPGGSATGGANPGGASSGGSATGGSATGGASSGGPGQGGTSPNGGSGGDLDCFSPDNSPRIALAPNAMGCACDAEEDVDQCIVVPEGSALRMVAMVCVDGRWQKVVDGPCLPDPTGPRCMIENRVFMEGGPVPVEFLCRLCSWCGGHPSCALIDCLPESCAAGTEQGSRCRQCGPVGGCSIMEHGCFEPCEDSESCEFGICSDGMCSVGPCI